MKIPLASITFARDADGNLLNPRAGMDTTELQGSLAAFGQVEPIIVSPPINDGHAATDLGLRIVYSGHRRVVAARALGWIEIEALERPGVPDDNGVRAAMLAAHAQEAHDPLKVAEAIRAMLADGWDKLTVARVMAIQPQKVDVLLSLAEAPASVQAAVAHGGMTLTAYGAVYAQPKAVQAAVVERVQAKAPAADGKRGPGRPSGALTVDAVRRAVKAIAAEQNPRLLDDEAVVAKVNGALIALGEVVAQYAGGLPSNIAWRLGAQLVDARKQIDALLGGAV